MSQKPETITAIWPEKELCAQFNLPYNEKTGRSTQVSYWIRAGLKHAERAKRRFFFEQDVIDFLWTVRENG